MALLSWLWGVVALFVTSVCNGVGSSICPENVLASASKCFPSHFSNGLISNLSAVQQHCQNGVFQESLACLTRIQDSCHDDKKKQQLLKSYMDVSKWRNSWGVLCSSVQLLQKHSSCWTVTSQRSAQCIQKQMMQLRQRLMKADDDRSSRSSSGSLSSSSSSRSTSAMALDNLKLYCNTSKEILGCFQPTLKELCAPEASRLLENMYLAFQPPLCERRGHVVSEDNSCSNHAHSATSTSVVTNVFALLSMMYAQLHRYFMI